MSGGNVFPRLDDALAATDFGWSFCLVGEDQPAQLAALTRGLRGDPVTGRGKHIGSAFSYWGIGPTIAWAHASNDLFYPVMRESITSFARNWASCAPDLANTPYHLVSLGVGTGEKDAILIADLGRTNPDLVYLPVDMSLEMLRLGTGEAARRLPRGRVLPVQLDFATADNVAELRRLAHDLLGDAPILYTLLGNTLANVDADAELLATMAGLLRPQDRFLLEVATTRVLDHRDRQAAEEYANSRAFKEFATSALWHNTDLTVDMNSVQFHGSVEDDRALVVEVQYHNLTGATIHLTLPNHAVVAFGPDETIRLYLTRKYWGAGLDRMVADAGVHKVRTTGTRTGRGADRTGFGIALLLLTSDDNGPRSPVAEDLWPANQPRRR